jgi:hypothetical protein
MLARTQGVDPKIGTGAVIAPHFPATDDDFVFPLACRIADLEGGKDAVFAAVADLQWLRTGSLPPQLDLLIP